MNLRAWFRRMILGAHEERRVIEEGRREYESARDRLRAMKLELEIERRKTTPDYDSGRMRHV